jgi:hypothetical protein
MSVTLDSSAHFVRCEKKVLMVATLEARNTNEVMLAPMVGSGEFAFKESLESGGRFCIGAL